MEDHCFDQIVPRSSPLEAGILHHCSHSEFLLSVSIKEKHKRKNNESRRHPHHDYYDCVNRNHTHHHHHHQNHAHSHSGHPTRLLARLPQAQERNEGHTAGAADHHGLRDNRDGDDGNDVMMMVSLMATVVRWMMVKVVKLVVFEKE